MSQVINTDRELYALRPAAARYERAIGKARGLSVRVFPNGCKAFVIRYVGDTGVRRALQLGEYPQISLADARLKAAALRVEIASGKDPAAERAAVRAEAKFGESFEDLAEGYWKAAAIGVHGGRRRPLRTETIDRQKGLYDRYVRPVFGPRRFKDIRRAEIRAFMESFVREGRLSASSIAAIGDVVRALFAYALHNDHIEANPSIGLTRPITPNSRTRMFKEDPLAAILRALSDAAGSDEGRADPHARMGPHMALGLLFLIHTMTRRNEVAGAHRDEVDLKARVWVIPGARTKNRLDHVVPLTDAAVAILERALKLPGASEDGFLFPSPGNPRAHLEARAMTRAVNRLCVRLEIPAGSPHDFRRTGSTILTGERYGVRRFIVGKVLGHTSHEGAAVTSVYDRNEYLPEKRKALKAWSGHLEELAEPPTARKAATRKGELLKPAPSAEVVDFAERRRRAHRKS